MSVVIQHLRPLSNTTTVQACELDGAWGDDLLFEVLECGGLHLVITEVVPVSGGADKNKQTKNRVLVLSGI